MDGPAPAPFQPGGRVEPPYFIDREAELDELSLAMAGLSAHYLVEGQRRVGKSSFLLNASNRARRENSRLAIIDIDCLQLGSVRDLADRIVQGTLAHYKDKHSVKGWLVLQATALEGAIREALGKIEKVTVKSVKRILTVFVDFREGRVDEMGLLREAFEFADRFASEAGFGTVVLLDEVQELTKFEGAIFGLFKSVGDRAKNLRFVFSGSAPRVLERVFFGKAGALYQMALRISLGPLPEGETKRFIDARLAAVALRAEAPAVDRWIALSGGIPFYVQRIGHAVYFQAMHERRAAVDTGLVERACEQVMLQMGGDFDARISAKFSATQRRILVVLSKRGPLRRVDLARALARKSTSISEDLGKLVEWMEVVRERRGVYRMADPLMAAWLSQSRFADQPVRPAGRRRRRPA